MSASRDLRGSIHNRYINVDQKRERQRWARLLNVDEALLREAIELVGSAVEDVRTYLELKSMRAGGRRPARRALPSRH